MRSALVFTANSVTPNRFQLCSTVFAAVRRLHQRSHVVSDSINDAFSVCSGDLNPEKIAERFLAASTFPIAVNGQAGGYIGPKL